MILPEKAKQPTMYFIGVTTSQSAIMHVFPLWAQALGLQDVVIKGIDIELQAEPEIYRKVVQFIKEDELSLGALVTTHKLALFAAAHDLFDYLDVYALAFQELSSISKKEGKLEGYAKDPISSGLAMETFIPEHFWKENQGEVCILGAGGSALSIASYLIQECHGYDRPSKIYASDRVLNRLDHMSRIMSTINHASTAFEYKMIENEHDNDRLVSSLKPYSLIINATGLGKDRPGSPLTDAACFPPNSLVWELNYRGELLFQKQAERQRVAQQLQLHDGWVYFIHGWTQVIAEVFHISISVKQIEELSEIAF
ncbi:shikimate dehydrogenase [Paenibacillus sp. N3.4]|uniref:shikimate dehydrogenase family protein n=1 Tax=Paenibacillus sp. N3.4 TaxID=2603222 RepID=UPI0011C9FD8A|nr:shikimate dehydrogenase [Paenibacillus sp. N3.4]TXK77192.1 shikimate dehydrogenase [Paenibacillus sp. N3.4]